MPHRNQALAEQLRQILSKALYFDMRDPSIEGVTITRVKVSPDLQYADVRFSIAEDGRDPATAVQALNRAKGALKGVLARKMNLRKVPDLRFHYDEDADAERRISQILQGLDIPEQETDES